MVVRSQSLRFLVRGTRTPLEKMLVPGLGEGKNKTVLKQLKGTNEEMFQNHRGHVEGYARNCKGLLMYKNWINTSNELNIYWVIPIGCTSLNL